MSYNLFFYNDYSVIKNVVMLIILSIILFIILKKVLFKLENVKLVSKEKIDKKEFIVYAIIIISALSLAFIANLPYTIHADLSSQLEQVVTGKYSNWHPIFYTFIMIGIPYKIFETISSIVIFQLIFIFAIMLYFCYFTRKYFLNYKATILLLLIIVCNPVYLQSAVFLYKDIIFSYFVMLGTMFLIEIYLSDGKWFNSTKNKVWFIIMCICISNFRHNGIANFILMMILLILYYKDYRKFLGIFTITLILTRSIIIGPVFAHFGLGKSGGLGEVMGIPFNQISYIYNTGGKLTDEQLNMMDSLVPLKNWEIYYSISSFNNIRWSGPYNWGYLNTHISDFIKMYFKLALKYPGKTLTSYVNVTYPVWGINRPRNFIYTIYNEADSKKNVVKSKFIKYYNSLELSRYKLLVFDVGNSLCYIIFTLFIIFGRYKKDIKRYIPYILVLSNALIIMCVIYGEETRLVLSSLLCSYPLILFSLSNSRKEKFKKSNKI